MAASRQRARERALRRRGERRVAIGERRERGEEVGTIGAAFDGERALARPRAGSPPDRGSDAIRVGRPRRFKPAAARMIAS